MASGGGRSCLAVALTVMMVTQVLLLNADAAAAAAAAAAKKEMMCENVAVEYCTFSVSSAGNRCVLEKSHNADGTFHYQCMASVVMAENFAEWVESDECVSACGADRKAVGMSSDSFMESAQLQKMCSPRCLQSCPNLVDLFTEVAAGEGMSLGHVCRAHAAAAAHDEAFLRRIMLASELPFHLAFNWDDVAGLAPAPAPLPFPFPY